ANEYITVLFLFLNLRHLPLSSKYIHIQSRHSRIVERTSSFCSRAYEGGNLLAKTFKTIIFAMITLFLTLCLIIFPEESLHASIPGLSAWGEVVFPSLLPFFITAELLISFGVVQFIGVLFEPVMRPLFKVPGVGSFAWMVGMASGYPSGAKISASLREKKAISRIEAERLVSFSNASSPLFIFGAMAVGFLNNAKLGILLAATHYGTNAIVGMLMRF